MSKLSKIESEYFDNIKESKKELNYKINGKKYVQNVVIKKIEDVFT
jgi:hypothetical protein